MVRSIGAAITLISVVLVEPSVQVAWRDVMQQDRGWYATADARAIADTVLLHQRASGGWPKDTDMTRPPEAAVLEAAMQRPDATIDNGATTIEMRLLARVSRASGGKARYDDAVRRGIDYLLASQYENGGWPQFFPLRRDYSRHITFNDDAMVNVMAVLDDVSHGRMPFEGLDETRRRAAAAAVARGVTVMLRTQIRVGGRLTAWCAQHDERTFEPRGARTYEHPSLSGNETVGIVRFLMRIEEPGADVVAAVEAAVAWLRAVALRGVRIDRMTAADGPDRVAVADPNAPLVWARFYEIGTNRPIFSGRDGIIRSSLAEIERERRGGYAWYGTWARTLLDEDYPAWQARRRR